MKVIKFTPPEQISDTDDLIQRIAHTLETELPTATRAVVILCEENEKSNMKNIAIHTLGVVPSNGVSLMEMTKALMLRDMEFLG